MTRFDALLLAYLAAAAALAVPVGVLVSDAVMRAEATIHQIEQGKAVG